MPKCPCTARLVVRWPDGREERACRLHTGVMLHRVLGADPAGASHAAVFLLTERHAQRCEVDAQTPVVDDGWPDAVHDDMASRRVQLVPA